MASFDFVECSSRSYKFFWEQRAVLLRLALVPVIIKLICFIGVTAFVDENNFLRQGLFLLPSYFAEGWLIAQCIRMALYEETWPTTFSGNKAEDKALHESRSRSILSATAIYVLIKLAVAFLAGYVMTQQAAILSGDPSVRQPPPPGAEGFFLGVLVFAIILYGFRFLWLYVPAAMDWPVGAFLKRIKAFTSSFSFIGTWLLFFVPFSLALVIISKMLQSVFPGEPEEISNMYKYSVVVVQAFLELAMTSIASVAVAYGVKSIYDGTNRPTPIL